MSITLTRFGTLSGFAVTLAAGWVIGQWTAEPDTTYVPAPTPATVVTVDPYDQDSFPCAGDEYLGYHPSFGPDSVGCVHIDYLMDMDE